MDSGLLIDTFEPILIENLVKQSVPTSRAELNHRDFADYLWTEYDNTTSHMERKHIDEILSNLDHVEAQLRREIMMADRTYLLYEGTFTPTTIDGRPACQSLNLRGKVMVPGHKYRLSYKSVLAWFDQLDRHGITVVHTIDPVGTANLLVALYNNSQKPLEEHTTFQRIIKQKVYPKSKSQQDLWIATLMGIEGAQLGEVTARRLIYQFGDPWTVFNRSLQELAETPGVGMVTARRFWKSIGRKQ